MGRYFFFRIVGEKARDIGMKHMSTLAYLMKKAKEEDLNFKSKNEMRIKKFVFI